MGLGCGAASQLVCRGPEDASRACGTSPALRLFLRLAVRAPPRLLVRLRMSLCAPGTERPAWGAGRLAPSWAPRIRRIQG